MARSKALLPHLCSDQLRHFPQELVAEWAECLIVADVTKEKGLEGRRYIADRRSSTVFKSIRLLVGSPASPPFSWDLPMVGIPAKIELGFLDERLGYARPPRRMTFFGSADQLPSKIRR